MRPPSSSGTAASQTVDTFITVGNVEKEVFFMVFLVELTHCGTGGWNDIVDKEKQGVLSSEMNSLPDQEVELTNCEIRRHQVFLFVQVSYPSFGSLFYYHLNLPQTHLFVFVHAVQH